MEMTSFEQITLEVQTCITCGVMFGIPKVLDRKLRENKAVFYCPNGHDQHYIGESEADKPRRELKRKEQELANTAIEKINLQNDLTKAERKLKRVAKGVCTCCNRKFQDLQRHMKTKHPEIVNKTKSK